MLSSNYTWNGLGVMLLALSQVVVLTTATEIHERRKAGSDPMREASVRCTLDATLTTKVSTAHFPIATGHSAYSLCDEPLSPLR